MWFKKFYWGHKYYSIEKLISIQCWHMICKVTVHYFIRIPPPSQKRGTKTCSICLQMLQKNSFELKILHGDNIKMKIWNPSKSSVWLDKERVHRFFARPHFLGVFLFLGFLRDVFHIKHNRWVSSDRGRHWFIGYNVRGKIGNMKSHLSGNTICICSGGQVTIQTGCLIRKTL